MPRFFLTFGAFDHRHHEHLLNFGYGLFITKYTKFVWPVLSCLVFPRPVEEGLLAIHAVPSLPCRHQERHSGK
jgi:hypothetical protein